MECWIEVTSGMRWERMLREGVALEAPNSARYRTLFRGLRAEDLVLHNLITSLTNSPRVRSKVVAASRVTADPGIEKRNIVAKCSDTVELPVPISLKRLRRMNPKSEAFSVLLRMNMQRYLSRIEWSDFESIALLSQRNFQALVGLAPSLLRAQG